MRWVAAAVVMCACAGAEKKPTVAELYGPGVTVAEGTVADVSEGQLVLVKSQRAEATATSFTLDGGTVFLAPGGASTSWAELDPGEKVRVVHKTGTDGEPAAVRVELIRGDAAAP